MVRRLLDRKPLNSFTSDDDWSIVSLYFATRNLGKFREARLLMTEYGVTVERLDVDKVEIQSDKLEEIASYAALDLASKFKVAVIVEDAGLFVCSLRGFPGPYSSYVYKTLGLWGLLKLMDGLEDRRAYFLSAVAYSEPGGFVKVFTGRVDGFITSKPRGCGGFGFDPIFTPVEGDGRTFAEMDTAEKNRFSHRARAFRKLTLWLRQKKMGR